MAGVIKQDSKTKCWSTGHMGTLEGIAYGEEGKGRR